MILRQHVSQEYVNSIQLIAFLQANYA